MYAACVSSLSHIRLFVTPWTVAHQACLSTGILQARILGWVAMPSSRVSPQSRDWTQVSCISSWYFTIWATKEAQFLNTIYWFYNQKIPI